MSGVLERMVLRARSALAGIEPVFAPRYAPSEVFHESGDRPTAAVESGVRRAPAPRPRRTGAAPTSRTTPQDLATARSSPVTPAFSEEGARAAASPHHDPVVDGMPSPRSVADYAHVSFADVSSDAPPAPLPTTPDRHEESATGEPLVVSVRTRSTDGDTTPSSRKALGYDNRRHADAVAELFNEGAVPAPISKKHSPPDAPAPAAPAQVTISIGHVEVRAAPVSPPARRPAFRPRVTLDEYLRRSGDSR
jgi:hypothetical protein